jgi:hypothetical protein
VILLGPVAHIVYVPRLKAAFDHASWSGMVPPSGLTPAPLLSGTALQVVPCEFLGTGVADPIFQLLQPPSRTARHDLVAPSAAVGPQHEHLVSEQGDSGTPRERRRSGRSHHRDLAISNPIQSRKRSSTMRSRSATLSANYQELSERQVKNLDLDPHRRHYKCLVEGCERVFGRKSNADNHIRTHLDDKPFVCSLDTWCAYLNYPTCSSLLCYVLTVD